MAMEALAQLDDVAFVRYASVYKNFTEARDFGQFLDALRSGKKDTLADE